MKIQTNLLFVLILSGLCGVVSCKKDKATPENNLAGPGPSAQPEPGIYIPAKLTSGKSNIIFSYTKAAALTKIDYENGDSTILKFNTAGKPLEFRSYESSKIVSASYYSRDLNGLITKAQVYRFVGKDEFKTGSYTITYGSDGKITTVAYYDKENRLLEEQQYGYTAEGNLATQKSALSDAAYSYDLKNGLFKNAGYAWLFALEKENSLFLSIVNNVERCTFPLENSGNQLMSYTYNNAGYPATITSTVLGITATAKVTYQ